MGNACAKGGDRSDAHEQKVDKKAKPQVNGAPAQTGTTAPMAVGTAVQPGGAHPVRPARPAPLSIHSVLGRPTEDVKTKYTIGKELGRGQFGVTHLCVDRETGAQYACKSIAKRKLQSKEDIEDVRREVSIMHHLKGHNNIVQLFGAYEDKHAVHLVMEVCAGGELFDRIIAKGHYTEKQAAATLRIIVGVVQACHSLGVMHRDLKPENFLLADKSEDAALKATDFGLSVYFRPGEKFSDIVGSAYYVAPEVLRRNYGPEADVWSCGVILYILLCGVPPFWAETEQGIFDAVLRGTIDFQSDPWPRISPSAKDLVKRMLRQDPKERLTAHQVLTHPWARVDGDAPDKPLDNAVLTRLKKFSAMNKVKKVALKIIANSLSEEEISGLRAMFQSLDTDNSGAITFEELKTGLKKLGSNLAEEEVRKLMEAADADNSGTLDYQEFVAATMAASKAIEDDKLVAAFAAIDADGDGEITVDELEAVLVRNGMADHEKVADIVKEIDTNNDGKIDYEEFVAMMRQEAVDKGPSVRQRRVR
ncbi:Serine Threonine protein kinase [Klebsormidium nitens]|uniref:non-specific serine/threonine protein kinase n=1 Tax=Klebsormidium nitens TaxID=105231 RepID=A0A1Y1IF45_KLENI|nr:Serine Threonine protein kinase [Klebsormidium nitens]|eukprot:GAQ88622.1 Serine Threonine protein kinase [Klebsormidium nitens]